MATKSQLRIKKIAKISTVVLGLGLLLTMANVGDSILVSAQPNDKAETEVRLAANKPDSVFETQVDGEKLIINKQISNKQISKQIVKINKATINKTAHQRLQLHHLMKVSFSVNYLHSSMHRSLIKPMC